MKSQKFNAKYRFMQLQPIQTLYLHSAVTASKQPPQVKFCPFCFVYERFNVQCAIHRLAISYCGLWWFFWVCL